jgi:hypothetical protein
MRFDGYAGNVEGRPFEEVAQVLAMDLGGVLTRGRPVKRYGEVLRVEHGGHCAVWVGNDRGNGLVYFEGKGESSPELVESVRKRWPGHAVARGDVCEDYDGEGVFEHLLAGLREHKGPRVRGAFVQLSDDPGDPRTYGAGQRGGVAYTRLYEAGKMAERAHFGRPFWARLEGEFRPHYAADKKAAAVMSPLEFWGLTSWTKRVAEWAAEVEVPRYCPERLAPTFDRTREYLARVFRRHWEESLAEGRDWDCIGREIEAIWKADDDMAALLGGCRRH